MLSHYADKSRDITTKNAYGESSKRRLTDEELGPVGVEAWDNIQKAIDKLEVSNHPISPIDMFKTKMEERGYFVGEITGRSSGIDYVKQSDNSYKAYYKTFPALNEAQTKRATTNGFNNGDIDCLIGNKTMSTGISLHSSEKFSDQKQRHFLLLQPEGDINVAKQFFGRFDRTGQVNAPKITIGAANIPYERRVQSNLMGKLSSLSANTTANRESQVDFGETRDLLNKYGDRVAADIFRENPDINYRLNTPFSEDISYENGDLIKKLTGRLPILSIDEQEKVMNQIETGYDSLMKELDALGTNDLKNSTLDLDAVTLASVEVVPAKDDTGSSFTGPVNMDILDVKSGKKPYTSLEVVNLVRSELGLDNISPSTEITPDILEDSDIEKASRFRSFKEIASIESTRIDYQESRRNLFKTESSAAGFIQTTNNQAEFNKGMQRAFPIGTTIKIDAPNGDELYGIVLKHRSKPVVDNKSNPLRPSNNSISIAVTGGTKELELPYSKIGSSDDKYSLLPHFENVQQNDKELSILELFDNNQADRVQRFMMTGNLLNAASKLRGQGRIVHYADSNGERHPGFLMHKDFQPKSLENVPIKLSKVEQIESFTKEEGLILHSRDERLNFSYNNRNEQYMISVPKSKKNGGEFFLDQKLLEAATSPDNFETNEFISKGDRSYLYFDDSELKDVVKRLDEKWGLFATGKDIAVAKYLVGIEITDFDEVLERAVKTQQELQEKASISESHFDVDNTTVNDFSPDIQSKSTQQSVHSNLDTEELETETLSTEEIVNDELETETLSTEEIVNDELETETLSTEEITPQQLSLFDFEIVSSNNPSHDELSIKEEISQIDIQQQRVEYVASVAENLLNYVGENYYEGSKHIAFKDEETNRLTITTVDNTPLMTAQFNSDTDKWENIDSNLSEKDVSHFQTVQAIVTQRIEDKNNRIQQQEFVELLAPIIADYHDLRADEKHKFGGYSTGWDGENKILTLTDNTEEKEILTAKLNSDGWENINSNLSNWQVDELENYFMPELDTNTEELQAKRFEKVQPVVADILRNFHTNVYEGKHYFAQWDIDSMELTAWSNNERQPFLSAHWDKNFGWQDMSDSPISFKIAHHFTEDIQPTLEQYRERQNPGFER